MFYALKNLRGQTVFQLEKPWDTWANYPVPADITTKAQLDTWRKAVRTEHAFISGIAGVDPRARIVQGGKRNEMANPPKYMTAFIADYDAAASEVHVANILEKPASGYLPNYIVDSFSSGRKRLVWLFEKPFLLGGTYGAASGFVRKLAAEIRAKDYLPGFDDHSTDPNQYFAIGTNWKQLHSDPLPHHILSQWALVSDGQVHFTDHALSPPPLEDIAELVFDRFPGRWNGDFSLGARGLRFWDPVADNPTAAVVLAEGMRCFTGQSGFVSWEDIFGKRAIDELRGERQGVLRDRAVWCADTGKFWVNVTPGEGDPDWVQFGKEDFSSYLVCEVGLDDRRPRGGGPSRVQRFMNEVRTRQRVTEALPFVYRPQGKTEYMGDMYLNTATAKVLPPAPPLSAPNEDFHKAGQRAFPFLHAFLTNFYAPVRVRPAHVPESVSLREVQLWHVLAWWQRIYLSGLNMSPRAGQAIVTAGPRGRGKTMFTHAILAKSLGGSADGSAFLLGGEPWTSVVLHKPLITVDDDTVGDDIRKHNAYTTTLKKLVANSQATYNKKFGSAGRVEWLGRSAISCNLDPDSSRTIPSLTQSNADKVNLLLAGHGIDLPDRGEIDRLIGAELPHLLRWMVDWTPQGWLLAGDERFYIRGFHHPALLEVSAQHGVAINVLEMLREVYDCFHDATSDDTANDHGVHVRREKDKDGSVKRVFDWTGSVRRLHKMMRRLEVAQVDRFNFQQLGTMLGVLAGRGFKIEKLPGQDWRIIFDDDIITGKITSLDPDDAEAQALLEEHKEDGE